MSTPNWKHIFERTAAEPISDDPVEALEAVLKGVTKAISLAKRKQFDKAQAALESALFTGSIILEVDTFRDAELSARGEHEGNYPSWAR